MNNLTCYIKTPTHRNRHKAREGLGQQKKVSVLSKQSSSGTTRQINGEASTTERLPFYFRSLCSLDSTEACGFLVSTPPAAASFSGRLRLPSFNVTTQVVFCSKKPVWLGGNCGWNDAVCAPLASNMNCAHRPLVSQPATPAS